MARVRDRLRLVPGTTLADLDPHGTPAFDGGKSDGKRALAALGPELADLQEKLFAEAYTGGRRSVLLVLQGMDTSGKGGVLRHVVGLLSPDGVRLTSFKAPTEEERAHDFLWRVEPRAPAPGMIGVFDRSHYEDVLVARVHALAPPEEIERRYAAINDFEQRLVDAGTVVVKCFLHLSREEQRQRLLARLDHPTKQWKFKPGDVDERALWPAYQAAYETVLERCSTPAAPWHVVPSDRKWYRNWAIGALLLETLRDLDPGWPAPDYDVDAQRERLEEEDR
ncbi:MAG: polyphosphate kinase 2 family protein [Marmoricola sp.]